MLRVVVVVVVVLVAVSAAVSAKFRRSSLEPSVTPAPTVDLLHVHLRANPYGVDDDIAPQP
jgi:hypothetical protein